MSSTRKVWLFALLAYGWSWFFWIPSALMARGFSMPTSLDTFFSLSFSLGGWGPLLSAFLVTYWGLKKEGVKDLLRRGVKYRFGLIWYLVALFLFPILVGGSLFVAALTGAPLPELEAFAEPIAIPISFVIVFFTTGPLQEEFGWRGFAQERLQGRWSALTTSIVVGAMWGLWHLPLFFVPEMGFYYGRPIWGLILSTILISIPIAWVYNNTGRSVLAAMLMHASFNWSHFLFPTLDSDRAGLILFVLEAVVAVAVVLVWGSSTLTREPRTPNKGTSEEFA
jgi:membrane protease YdiL (CAAX protease family)